MTRSSRRPAFGVAGALAAALVAAACQAGGAGSPKLAGSPATDADVAVASSAELGDIVVDAEGRTLYVYLEDSPGTSACADACAASWPPALADGPAPTAGGGVTAEVGTLRRADGELQLTLDGRALYRYANDAAPGDATGEGVGQVWYAARPDGRTPAPGGAASAEPSASETADETQGYDPYDY